MSVPRFGALVAAGAIVAAQMLLFFPSPARAAEEAPPKDAGAAKKPRTSTRSWHRSAPRLVLVSDAGEREIAVRDFRFVYFDRDYIDRRAPRDENPHGRRVAVQDRRLDCRCLRFEDWTKMAFSHLREIAISYPDAGGESSVRFVTNGGGVREVSGGALYGATRSLPPRFTATIDGVAREFPLVLSPGTDETWPAERLVRVLFGPPPPPPPAPRRRP